MAYFVAEKRFLNIHSATLLNKTFGSLKFDSPSQFSLKTLKNIYLKPDLSDWYIFLCTFCSKFV